MVAEVLLSLMCYITADVLTHCGDQCHHAAVCCIHHPHALGLTATTHAPQVPTPNISEFTSYYLVLMAGQHGGFYKKVSDIVKTLNTCSEDMLVGGVHV